MSGTFAWGRDGRPALYRKNYMARANLKVTGEAVLARNWGVLKRIDFDIERRDGTWQHLSRETYDRGDAAAILLIDPERRIVVLTRQFRLPVHLEGRDSFVIEVCAGLLDGDDPATCAIREAAEETGYRVRRLTRVFDVYPSPGSVKEKVHLFIGEIAADDLVSAGGGLAHEGEDIEVVELGFGRALEMIESGKIADAKSILLIQYAALKGMLS